MYLCTPTASSRLLVNVFSPNVAYFFPGYERQVNIWSYINRSPYTKHIKVIVENTSWHGHEPTVLVCRRKNSLGIWRNSLQIWTCEYTDANPCLMLWTGIWNMWLTNLIWSLMDCFTIIIAEWHWFLPSPSAYLKLFHFACLIDFHVHFVHYLTGSW